MNLSPHGFIAAVSIGNALFYAFAAMIACASLVMVISHNIVHTAVGLLFALLGVGPSLPQVMVALTLGAILLIALIAAIHNVTPTLPHSQPGPEQYPMDSLGQALLGDALAPFELISVLLLVAMIGAAYLARGRKRSNENSGRPAP